MQNTAELKEKWLASQHKAYTGWINAHLAHKKEKLRQLSDISDGSKLVTLLDILEKRKLKQFRVTNRNPRHKYDQLETIGLVLRHLQTVGQKWSTELSPELINNGHEQSLLALAWRFVLTYGIAQEVNIQGQKMFSGTPEEMLKQWCNAKLQGSGIKCKNFTKSFQNPQIFCALFNHALKEEDKILAEDMEGLSVREAMDAVFDIAERQLAVPRLIDVNDLLEAPDKQSIMTYVSLIRSAVHASEKAHKQVEQSMNQMQSVFDTMENQLKDRIGFLERTVEAGVNTQKQTESALERERERRIQDSEESKMKVAGITSERDQLQAQVLQLQEMVARLEAEKRQNSQVLEDKEMMLRSSEARVVELMNSSTDNEIVKSLNEENSLLKEKLEEQSQTFAAEKKEHENIFQEIKSKLARSNQAGKKFRDQAKAAEAELVHAKINADQDRNQLASKESELGDYRIYVKELRDQLTNSEVVFKLQLQEMGHLIDELREREQQNEVKYQRMIEDLQEQHHLDLESVAKAHSPALQQDIIEPQPKQFYNEFTDRNMQQHADQQKAKRVRKNSKWNQIQAKSWEKTIDEQKSKWGNPKLIITWKFIVDGMDEHTVVLNHNTYQRNGQSKRILTVDGVEQFNEKSDAATFYCTLGHHVCQVFIRVPNEVSSSGTAFEYDLYIDKMPFEDLRREYYIEMQRQRAIQKQYE